MTNKSRTRLVYSTDPDPPPAQESAVAPTYPSAAGQTARIWRDSKRRRGKTVTVIGGLDHDPATLEALLKKLKQQCGAGVALKTPLSELEIESLDLAVIVFDIEDTFGIEIPYNANEEVEAFATVGSVVDRVKSIIAETKASGAAA